VQLEREAHADALRAVLVDPLADVLPCHKLGVA
jgi:hypothetical protein